MGTSAFILFKENHSIPIQSIITALCDVCRENNLYYMGSSEEYDSDGKMKNSESCVSDYPFIEGYEDSKQLLLYLHDEPDEFQLLEFDFTEKGEVYFRAVTFEEFYEKDDVLLKVLHGFLQKYPSAYVWIECDWFYTLEDLEKIMAKPYDSSWYYTNPKDF